MPKGTPTHMDGLFALSDEERAAYGAKKLPRDLNGVPFEGEALRLWEEEHLRVYRLQQIAALEEKERQLSRSLEEAKRQVALFDGLLAEADRRRREFLERLGS